MMTITTLRIYDLLHVQKSALINFRGVTGTVKTK